MSEYSLTSGAVATVYRPSTASVTVLAQGTPISGINGEDGADGKTVRYGTGAPADALGADGDFYISTSYPPTLYGPKSGGTWPAGASMIGPQGPAGAGGGHPYLLMGA